jgi:hypothetical protein
MKMNKKYALLSLVTAVAVMGMSLGSISLAQTPPVSCSPSSSTVSSNQAATLTASGGNGVYSWSGTNLNITNSAGTQFAVSYPTPGTYTVIVSSAGQSATCNVTVVAATAGSLVCSPAVQNVTLGQTASVTATGGTGTYVWSAPDLTITNPNGSGFSASYASAGLKTLTVTSGGVSSTCAVNVLAGAYIPPTPPVTPGLPNTGGGYGK